LVHGEQASAEAVAFWEGCGARCLRCETASAGQIDVAAALRGLGDLGLTRVFCEGGGALAASLLGGDLVDALVGFTAGLALGAEGQPGIAALGVARLEEAPRFSLGDVRAIGGDVMTAWSRMPRGTDRR